MSRSQALPALPDPEPARHLLIAWYGRHARELPWRGDSDPYHVLVSEIMLQQTQVDRVISKYREFLERFPSIELLARSPLADVIRQWQGLGYNRRAVRLWNIARQVRDRSQGRLPPDVDALLRLEGIGRYTAAAVASFAFHLDVATVDTNVRRVLRRLYDGVEAPPRTETALWRLAESLVPAGRSAAWNQALMDLGATICVSQRPRCLACPVQHACVAFAQFQASNDRDRDAFFADAEGAYPARAAQPRFEGSTRYYRGKVVATLGALPLGAKVPMDALGRSIREGTEGYDAGWLRPLLDGLARDGLIEMSDVEGSGGPAVSLPSSEGS